MIALFLGPFVYYLSSIFVYPLLFQPPRGVWDSWLKSCGWSFGNTLNLIASYNDDAQYDDYAYGGSHDNDNDDNDENYDDCKNNDDDLDLYDTDN